MPNHSEYLSAWQDAMHFGLMDGRPFSASGMEITTPM